MLYITAIAYELSCGKSDRNIAIGIEILSKQPAGVKS